jgi:hypothetical protein
MHLVDGAADPKGAAPRNEIMLSFRRIMRVPRIEAAREAHFLLHSGLRAYVVRSRGVAVEKRLFLGTELMVDYGGRHAVQVVLSGRMRVGDGSRERWLEAGEVSLQRRAFSDERWEGERFEVLVLEWTPAWGEGECPEWSVDRVAPIDRARLAAWAARVVDEELLPDAAAAHLAALLEVLARAGIPVRRAAALDLIEEVPAAARHLVAPLGASLSNLGGRPMLVDLETALGRSARHLRRGLSELHRYYDFYGGSWHRLRHWWRLSMATTLMTAPGATTELVGDVLGYGSPRSFCLAMAQAGLPSPGRIARAVTELR